ncbi:MAG: hypothetical protein WB783_00280 [Arenicellales bacterium]
MTNTKKRRFLGALAVSGAALSSTGQWVKPIVQGVVLPAHAEMSGELPSSPVRLYGASDPLTPKCGALTACSIGSGGGMERIKLYNSANSPATVLGASSTNPDQIISDVVFPLVIDAMSSSCGFLVTDSDSCPGLNSAVITVQVEGFADLKIDVPLT